MYADFYGLSEKPFNLVPDPRYLFLANSHREALAHLLYGIEQGEGFIQVIGQVGTGKTTLCRTLLERVAEDVEVAYIFNPSGSEIELLAAISREFALPTTASSRSELIEEINRFLLKQKAAGGRAVLVIDEAQELEPEVLEQIRLLSNLETEREKLIQIVLIGQPELEENLNRPDMRQLRQRITVRWRLEPFSRAEVSAYLEHRLKVAGLEGPSPFSAAAVRAIYRASGGVPRVVNALADRTLLAGYSAGQQRIDVRLVRKALKELPTRVGSAWRRSMGIPLGVAGGLVGCGFLIGLLYVAWGPVADGRMAALPGVSSSQAALLDAPPDFDAARRAAGAVGVRTSLEGALASLTAGSSAARALNALVDAWGYKMLVRGEVTPNSFSSVVGEFSRLRVFATRSTSDQLERVNLPAIIELRLGEERRYAAVLEMERREIGLGLDADRFMLTAEDLERLWTGRTFYLWTNYESLPALGSGMSGSAVRWIQARLTELGYMRRGDATGELDSGTMRAIRSFQTAHALEESGEVGPATLIALYQALHYGAPRLAVRSDRSEGS